MGRDAIIVAAFMRHLPIGLMLILVSAVTGCTTTYSSKINSVTEASSIGRNYKELRNSSNSSFDAQEHFLGGYSSYYEIKFTPSQKMIKSFESMEYAPMGYWVLPCTRSKKDKDSYIGSTVLTVEEHSNSGNMEYVAFIPRPLRIAMDDQSSINVTGYHDYLKNSISIAKADELCLYVGASEYFGKSITSSLGSLSELGIGLD